MLTAAYRWLKFLPTSAELRWQIAATRRLLNGKHAWFGLDRLAVPGFGTELLRVDFAPRISPRPSWGQGLAAHGELEKIFDANIQEQLELLVSILGFSKDTVEWPVHEDKQRPGLLRRYRPRRYVEVGSGLSTRVAYQARLAGGFPMEIVSIDPEPRRDVSELCDIVVRKRLEDVDSGEFDADLITEDSVLFLDGSHRAFAGSDVTTFFFELLPILPAGCLVHIHDVYLPSDYPEGFRDRFWSEQYLLAAWLLGGGRRLQIVLACAHLSSLEKTRVVTRDAIGESNLSGCSLWMRIRS